MHNKNKVLVVIDSFLPEVGGIQTILYNICSHYKSDEIIVLTQPCPGNNEFDKKQDYKIIRKNFYFNNKHTVIFYLPLLFQIIILKIIYRFKCVYFANLLPGGRLGPLLNKLLNIDYYLYIFAMEIIAPLKNDPAAHKVISKVLQHAAKIITISEYTMREIKKFDVDETRMFKVKLGVNLKQFYPKEKNDKIVSELQLKNKKVVLIAGRLVARKGFDNLIKSFRFVIESIPEAICLIIGDGNKEEKQRLKDIVNSYKLSEHVRFLGKKKYMEMNEYFNLCDIFVMPSREIDSEGDVEGFGIVFIEANACKKPVIGGNSGGVGDAIINEVNGVLVDPNDPRDISNAIIRILSDKDYYDKLSTNGYERVINEFSWDKVVTLIKQNL